MGVDFGQNNRGGAGNQPGKDLRADIPAQAALAAYCPIGRLRAVRDDARSQRNGFSFAPPVFF
jgi:hypothetical protein